MKLLIVEDNSEMRRLIKSLVGKLAKEVHECPDGGEALAAYATHRPDYVLMDIEMSGMDGIRATGQIKASFPEARIIIVTNYDDGDFREAAREAGACAYVVKENLHQLRPLLAEMERQH